MNCIQVGNRIKKWSLKFHWHILDVGKVEGRIHKLTSAFKEKASQSLSKPYYGECLSL